MGRGEGPNVSSHGLMATCQLPPARGAYIEVRRGAYVIVGRVVWSSHDRFGLYAQDTIAADALTSVALPKSGERRRKPREAPGARYSVPSATELAAQSARFARMFDFGVVASAVIASAFLIANIALEAFAAPLEPVRLAMSGERPRGD